MSLYSFGVGLAALFFCDEPNCERLGETARRAGVVVFGAVVLAAIALVVSAFRDDFTIAYIFHHSNRDLPVPYKFATLWSGQEGSLLFCYRRSPDTALSCDCATKPIHACSRTPPLFWLACKYFFSRS